MSPEPRRTRVKICGITRPEDAVAAAELGADAIGLVFWERSARAVDPARAASIAACLPPFVTVTALFVDPLPEHVHAVLDQVPVDLLQFHGEERPEECARYGRPFIKAVRMRSGVDAASTDAAWPAARALLLDAFVDGSPGGTGVAFDWSLLAARPLRPFVLAGGLSPANVADAIRAVDPWAVDVSGGVEIAKGIKDRRLMSAFLRGVASVER